MLEMSRWLINQACLLLSPPPHSPHFSPHDQGVAPEGSPPRPVCATSSLWLLMLLFLPLHPTLQGLYSRGVLRLYTSPTSPDLAPKGGSRDGCAGRRGSSPHPGAARLPGWSCYFQPNPPPSNPRGGHKACLWCQSLDGWVERGLD